MVTITRWTGRQARILREVALRMTIYEFAAHTNLSTSTIRDMENKGEQAHLRTSTQKILDETLAAAPEHAQQRFATALADVTDPATTETGQVGATREPAALDGVPQPGHPPATTLVVTAGRPGEHPDEGFGTPIRAWPMADTPNTVDDVRRRSALALATTAIAAAVAEPWNRLAYALASPSRLDEQTVEHLQGRTRDFFSREEHIPSRQLAVDLRTHIAQITQLAAGAPARFERSLMSSLGEALALAAWLAWDSGEVAAVQRVYEEAVTAAREAGDGPLLACAYSYRSYLAEADGDLPAAQDLLVSGQGYARSECNAGTRSWLAAREAEVAAALSDRTAALRALERALTAYDYAHPYHERPWTSFFTPSRLGSMVVTTYAHLDHPDLGTTTEAVIGSVPTTEVKTRAIILADVATAAIKRGEHDQGAELGHRALDQALTQEVTVARQHLRHLHTTIGQISAVPALAELDQRLVAHVM